MEIKSFGQKVCLSSPTMYGDEMKYITVEEGKAVIYFQDFPMPVVNWTGEEEESFF